MSIESIKARLEEAIRREWIWTAKTTGIDAKVVFEDESEANVGDLIYHPENKIRADLIAHAPSDLRALLAVAEAAMERCKYSDGRIDGEHCPLCASLAALESQP